VPLYHIYISDINRDYSCFAKTSQDLYVELCKNLLDLYVRQITRRRRVG
jgi:hypothetical protein